MNSECKEQTIDELVKDCITRTDEPSHFESSLEMMFECWLTHESVDGMDSAQRADVLQHYKHLRKLLRCID